MATRNLPTPPVTQIDVSLTIYDDDLSELDALVERVKILGGKFASRNRLLRIGSQLLLDLSPEQIIERLAAMPAYRK